MDRNLTYRAGLSRVYECSISSPMKKRLLRLLVLSAIGLVIGAAIGLWQGYSGQSAAVVKKGSSTISPIAGVAVGGAYELVDHLGEVRTDQDFTDSYKLIYFGFTYCPAICPTELQKISAVLAKLPEEKAALIQPLFITVDPERDTVQVMKDYVELFHEDIIGLTGTPEQIEVAKKAYRVFARQVHDEDSTEYTMDHSSYIYFMSPDDQLLGMYRIKDGPDYMIEDMQKFL